MFSFIFLFGTFKEKTTNKWNFLLKCKTFQSKEVNVSMILTVLITKLALKTNV